MEDVNHKYPNTAIPIAIIIIEIIPMVFALFINARKVIEIKRQYSNVSHPVKPICNTSTNSDLLISFCSGSLLPLLLGKGRSWTLLL